MFMQYTTISTTCTRAVAINKTKDHCTAQMPRSEVAMEGSTAPRGYGRGLRREDDCGRAVLLVSFFASEAPGGASLFFDVVYSIPLHRHLCTRRTSASDPPPLDIPRHP